MYEFVVTKSKILVNYLLTNKTALSYSWEITKCFSGRHIFVYLYLQKQNKFRETSKIGLKISTCVQPGADRKMRKWHYLVDRRAGLGWYRLHGEEKKPFVAAQEVEHMLQNAGLSKHKPQRIKRYTDIHGLYWINIKFGQLFATNTLIKLFNDVLKTVLYMHTDKSRFLDLRRLHELVQLCFYRRIWIVVLHAPSVWFPPVLSLFNNEL